MCYRKWINFFVGLFLMAALLSACGGDATSIPVSDGIESLATPPDAQRIELSEKEWSTALGGIKSLMDGGIVIISDGAVTFKEPKYAGLVAAGKPDTLAEFYQSKWKEKGWSNSGGAANFSGVTSLVFEKAEKRILVLLLGPISSIGVAELEKTIVNTKGKLKVDDTLILLTEGKVS